MLHGLGIKVLLVEAQGYGKVLNEEEFEFLADLGVAEGPVTMTVFTHNVAYQADDLDVYDSDCNDFSTAKAILMANFVREMSCFEQTHLVNYSENEITSDSNIIPYSQYLLETQNAAVQNTNSSTQQDAMILSVFEQLSNQVKTVNEDVRLQALVEGKKVIVNEASIRHDLRLDDAEGTACLPNAAIFEKLARMSTMASAIICLAKNQKFIFSKYIFESMMKNLEVGCTRPKEKGIVMQEPSKTPSPKPIVSSQQPKDKGKAKMVKSERPLKRKEHIMMDEQTDRDLEA
nr:hypothetical protein [Tanacetum cinerariifolium]